MTKSTNQLCVRAAAPEDKLHTKYVYTSELATFSNKI